MIGRPRGPIQQIRPALAVVSSSCCRLSGVGELARAPASVAVAATPPPSLAATHGGTERDDAADAGASPDVDPAPERHPGGRQVRGRSRLPRFAGTGRLPDPAVRSGFLVHDARARLGEHRDDPRGRSDLHRALPGGLPGQDLREPHAESGTHLVLGLGHELIREAATGHPGRQGRRGPDLRRFRQTGRPTTTSSRRPTRSSARSSSTRSSPVGSARHRRGEPGDHGLGQRPATRHVLRQPQADLVAGERDVARAQAGQ